MKIIILILEILMLILKRGYSEEDAARAVAFKYDIDFADLWSSFNKKRYGEK